MMTAHRKKKCVSILTVTGEPSSVVDSRMLTVA